MREVATEMKVTPPTKDDILAVLEQLDENNDNSVNQDEFFELVILVLSKMLESEQELQDKHDGKENCFGQILNMMNAKVATKMNMKNQEIMIDKQFGFKKDSVIKSPRSRKNGGF